MMPHLVHHHMRDLVRSLVPFCTVVVDIDGVHEMDPSRTDEALHARLQAQGLSSQPFGMAGLLLDQAVWQASDLPGQSLHVFGQAAAASSAASPMST